MADGKKISDGDNAKHTPSKTPTSVSMSDSRDVLGRIFEEQTQTFATLLPVGQGEFSNHGSPSTCEGSRTLMEPVPSPSGLTPINSAFTPISSGSTPRSAEQHTKVHAVGNHFPISPSHCVGLDTDELLLLKKCVHVSGRKNMSQRSRSLSPHHLQDTDVPVKDRLKGDKIPKVSLRPKEDDHLQEGSDHVDDEAIEGFTSDEADSHPKDSDSDSGDEVLAPAPLHYRQLQMAQIEALLKTKRDTEPWCN